MVNTKSFPPGFTIPDPPSEKDLLACVHCGLCLQHCPTYRLTGLETESPRGRIFLIRELAEGKQSVNDRFMEHTGLCLNCRNCESVCPSGVRYSVLLEAARGEIVAQKKFARKERFIRWLSFKQIFPHPRRLNLIVGLMGLYQRIGLQKIMRVSGVLKFFGRLGEMEAMLPERRLRAFHPHPRPLSQGERARKNIDLFLKHNWVAIAVNAAGCGANLKDYPELFRDDPQYQRRALEFSQRVKDVTELLGNTPLVAPAHAFRHRVTYQDACHLAHAQRIRLEPRKILRQIPGLELVEMRASDRCCGSAGIYNVVHPEMADQLIDEKIQNTAETRAEIVVTANIGCLLQLEYGKKRAGWNGRVLHIVELLDQAYVNES